MKFFFISMGFLFLVFNVVQAGSLYRWTDKDGKVHYGDRPAEDAVKTQQKKFSDTGGEADLPYSVRKARQDFPVTLYVAPDCGAGCVQAREFLNKRGVPFTEKNIANKEDLDAFKAATRSNSVPTLMIGKTPVAGFEAGQWNSELDIAGYPKIAPYGLRPVAPAQQKPEALPAAQQ